LSLAFLGKPPYQDLVLGVNMDIHKLSAQKREILGRKVKTLRKEGLLPANLYGKKIKSESLQVKLTDFVPIYKEAGETGVISLTVSGKSKGKGEEVSVLVANLQKDPISDSPIHVDFRKVDLKEKITAAVPVEFTGEAPCEKTGIGTVVQYLDEVEVEALPTDLPEKFEVDVSVLTEVDQAIYLKDLKIDKAKVTLKDDIQKIIAKVEPPQKVEEEAPPAEEVPVEGEVAGAPSGEVPSEEATEAPVPASNEKQTPSEP